MNNILGNSWKDRVRDLLHAEEMQKSASLTATNEGDVCKAFSDAAQGFVENKLGPLMKDENRIGFEVVKRNDDNTRMVGIFAFKVDKDLIFAPVFFLNGEIKGPLLYRCNTKTFVPADKEWAAYLADTMTHRDGKPRSREYLKDSPPRVQMHRLAFRPSGMAKGASVEEGPNEEVTVKALVKTLPTCNGEYKVDKDLGAKAGEQPKLSIGETTLKCAASAVDGAIHISAGGAEDILSEKEASAICSADKSPVTVLLEGAEVEIPASDVEAIKSACFDNVPDNAGEWAGNALDMLDKMTKGAGVLKEMLNEADYGKPMAEAVIKAASTSFEFANMLSACYPSPEDLLPDTFTKSAAKTPEVDLAIVYDSDELTKESSVADRYFRDGFYILDKRPTDGLTYVDESYDTKVTSITEPGVYSVLNGESGFMDDVFVCPVGEHGADDIAADRNITDRDEPVALSLGDSYYNRNKPKLLAIKDGKVSVRTVLYGVMKAEPKDYSSMSDAPSGTGLYAIFVGNSIIGPVAISKINNVDGVKHCKFSASSAFSHGVYSNKNEDDTLVVNPELDTTNIARGTFGTDAKWIKLDSKFEEHHDSNGWYHTKPIENLGDTTSLDEWIFKSLGASSAILKEVGDTEKKAYIIGDKNGYSDSMPKSVMLVKLARDMRIPATKAYELLDKADANGICKFAYIQKEATHLRLVERPIFDDEFDSEFGMPMQTPKKYALHVEGQQIMEPAAAIGDMLNPTTPTGLPNLTVTTTAPEDLRQLADTYGLPNVFEHATIGTLANTFDALRLMDKYIPKLEDAVDSLGRIKFMIHWCPQDFEKAYGDDDMMNLEAEVDSNFNACGALLLKLIKRADKDKHADVSLANL